MTTTIAVSRLNPVPQQVAQVPTGGSAPPQDLTTQLDNAVAAGAVSRDGADYVMKDGSRLSAKDGAFVYTAPSGVGLKLADQGSGVTLTNPENQSSQTRSGERLAVENGVLVVGPAGGARTPLATWAASLAPATGTQPAGTPTQSPAAEPSLAQAALTEAENQAKARGAANTAQAIAESKREVIDLENKAKERAAGVLGDRSIRARFAAIDANYRTKGLGEAAVAIGAKIDVLQDEMKALAKVQPPTQKIQARMAELQQLIMLYAKMQKILEDTAKLLARG